MVSCLESLDDLLGSRRTGSRAPWSSAVPGTTRRGSARARGRRRRTARSARHPRAPRPGPAARSRRRRARPSGPRRASRGREGRRSGWRHRCRDDREGSPARTRQGLGYHSANGRYSQIVSTLPIHSNCQTMSIGPSPSVWYAIYDAVGRLVRIESRACACSAVHSFTGSPTQNSFPSGSNITVHRSMPRRTSPDSCSGGNDGVRSRCHQALDLYLDRRLRPRGRGARGS